MQKMLTPDEKKSLTTLMVIWFTMLGALFTYVAVCYMIMTQSNFKTQYTPDVLQTPLFAGLSTIDCVYALALLILGIGILYFKSAYTKLVAKITHETFESEEEKFKAFRTRYTTLMFVNLAIFEVIAIIGIIVFLLTLDFSTFLNLVLLAAIGFVKVMPVQAKFSY
jgi:hypothetical protein